MERRMRHIPAILILGLLFQAPQVHAGASRDFEESESDFIDCGDPTELDLVSNDQDVTVLAWIKVETDPSFRRVFSRTEVGSPLDGFQIAFGSTNQSDVIATVYEDGTEFTVESNTEGDSPFSTGEWLRVGLTWDASADDVTVFANGAEFNGTGGGWGMGAADTCRIGARSSGSHFDGLIAHVQVWGNRILTLEEMENAWAYPGTMHIDDLVAYWPLMSAGSTEPDLSVSGNDATVSGAAEVADGPPVGMSGGVK